ncbi:MFS transporter [Streptomyces sp. NPDC059255]|uniref:caspase, EACC1-associated type n=1 Tax=Streptomyces sp. NPDC059255 TaxID=3346793 RepID=UPI0036BD6E13
MTRSPDPDRSRIVLIGTESHPEDGELHDLPAVRANLADLEEVLAGTTTGVVPPGNCAVIFDPATSSAVGETLATIAQQATDLLLVYYSGHGLVDERGRLHLSLAHTEVSQPRWTALPFETLREELLESPAAVRVLILDCCFSGRAFEAMADGQSTVAGQIDIDGTYTLTSTSANTTSYAPLGAKHTAFTGALLAALGSPNPLTLDGLFDRIRRDLAVRGLPRPQRRVVNAPGDLLLTRARDTMEDAQRTPATAVASTARPEAPPALATGLSSVPRLHGLALAAVLAFQFLVGLLAPVLNVALPAVTADPHSAAASLDWVGTLYLVSFAALLQPAGHIGDLWGRRHAFVAGALLFAAASLFAALTFSGMPLMVARVLQGVGAAFGTANGLALVAGRFRPALAIAVAGVIAIVAPVFGVLLGSGVTSAVSWTGVLTIYAFLAALLALVGWHYIDREEPKGHALTLAARTGWSTVGAAAIWAGGLAFVLAQARMEGWSDTTVVNALLASALALILSRVLAGRPERPATPFALLADRRQTGALLGILCVSAGLGAMGEFLFVALRAVEGFPSACAAVHLLPMTAAALAAGLFGPVALRRLGSGPSALLGTLLVALALYWLASLGSDGGYTDGMLWPLLLGGAGGGLAMAVLAMTALADISFHDLGTGAALLGTSQWVGGALAPAVLTPVLQAAVKRPGIDPDWYTYPTAYHSSAMPPVLEEWFAEGFSRVYLIGVSFPLLAVLVVGITFSRAAGKRPGKFR